jgi:hypothetical protein
MDDNIFIQNEQELKKEKEEFLLLCGSCLHFHSFYAESGVCKLEKDCVCKRKKPLIDIWNKKCEKWKLNPEYE